MSRRQTERRAFFFLSFHKINLYLNQKEKTITYTLNIALFLIDIFPIISVRRSGSLLLFTVWFALNKRRCCCCCWSTFPSESLRGGRSWKWNLAPVKFNIAIRMSEQMCAMKIAVLRRLLFIMFFLGLFFPFLLGCTGRQQWGRSENQDGILEADQTWGRKID